MNAYQKFIQLADQVTNEVIEQLEQGQVFWRKPWTSYGLPKNYVSGRYYEGFNAFFLNYLTDKKALGRPIFLPINRLKSWGDM